MIAKWAQKHDKFTETDSMPVLTFLGTDFYRKPSLADFFHVLHLASGFKACFLVLNLGFSHVLAAETRTQQL